MLGVAAGMALRAELAPPVKVRPVDCPPRALCRTRSGRKWRGSGVARPLRYCELSSPPLPVSDAVRRPPFPLRFSPAGILLVCSLHVGASRRIGPTRVAWLPGPKCARPVPVTPAPRPVPDTVRQEMARCRRAGAVPCAASWLRPHRLAQRPGSGSIGACVAKWPRPVPWAGACAPVAPPRAGCGLSGPPSLVILPVAVFRPVLSAAFPGTSIVAEALRPLLLCLGSSHRRRDFCHWQSSAVRPPAVAPLLRLRSPPA